MTIPPLRIVFELMNIPTLPDVIRERCKDQPKDIGSSIAAAMEPVVIPLSDVHTEEPKEESESEGEPTEPKEENSLLEPVAVEPKKGGSRTRRRGRNDKRKSRRVSYGDRK